MKTCFAGHGKEALEVIAREPPDVVLTDLLMPEMDGLELVERIKRDYPAIPVILMTAHGSEEIAVKGPADGGISLCAQEQPAAGLGAHDSRRAHRGERKAGSAASVSLLALGAFALHPGRRERRSRTARQFSAGTTAELEALWRHRPDPHRYRAARSLCERRRAWQFGVAVRPPQRTGRSVPADGGICGGGSSPIATGKSRCTRT